MKYITFVRCCPCWVCGRPPIPGTADHFPPRSRVGEWSDDKTWPLCVEHHVNPAFGIPMGRKRFNRIYNVDPAEAIKFLHYVYDHAGVAKIRETDRDRARGIGLIAVREARTGLGAIQPVPELLQREWRLNTSEEYHQQWAD